MSLSKPIPVSAGGEGRFYTRNRNSHQPKQEPMYRPPTPPPIETITSPTLSGGFQFWPFKVLHPSDSGFPQVAYPPENAAFSQEHLGMQNEPSSSWGFCPSPPVGFSSSPPYPMPLGFQWSSQPYVHASDINNSSSLPGTAESSFAFQHHQFAPHPSTPVSVFPSSPQMDLPAYDIAVSPEQGGADLTDATMYPPQPVPYFVNYGNSYMMPFPLDEISAPTTTLATVNSTVINGGRKPPNGRNQKAFNNTRSKSRSAFCTFCKNNRETKNFYQSHVLKNNDGITTCPILRKYTCPICSAVGDNAHTLRYCPENPDSLINNRSSGVTIISLRNLLKTKRNSRGIIGAYHYG